MGAKEEFSSCFEGKNFGVGCRVEVVAHTLRDFVNNHTGEGLAALKVDFRNAFNCVDRSCFLSSVHQSFPGLYDWVDWCYSSPSVLLENQPLSLLPVVYSRVTHWAPFFLVSS